MPTLSQSILSKIMRLYPLYSGAIRIANHPMVQRFGGEKEEFVWASVKGGEVLCNLNDLVGRTAFYTGDLDSKVSWICEKIVRKGDTVLDIGANVGIVSLWLSRLVGETGRVHSFEPNPSLQRLITESIARNNVTNVKLHPFGLGSKPDQMTLRILKENVGSGSLVLDYSAVDTDSITVNVETLDSVIEKECIKAIRFIKIDVEGFEGEVLKGARNVFQSIRPQAVLFEFAEPCEGTLGEQPVFRFLQEAGYGFFSVPKCRLRMYLERCDPKVADPKASVDYLAVLRDADFENIAKAIKAKL